MTTLRTSPRSTAGAVIALLIASLFAAASAEAAPARMKYACARNANGIKGLLHLVGTPRGCHGKGKIGVALPSDAPLHVCVSRGRGLIRLVDDLTRCTRSGSRRELRRDLPRPSSTDFCAVRGGKALRWRGSRTGCGRGELPVVLPARRGPMRGTLLEDVVATSEDHALRVAIHGRKHLPGLGRTFRLEAIDRSQTIGTVLPAGGAALVYDPAGRFDDLKLGDAASDSFAYRGTDGVHRTTSRVIVKLTGENDAPVGSPDQLSTGEDESAHLDVIKSSAAPGTPGADVDPDGDAVSLATVDSTAQHGGVVTRRADGTLDYDPAGAFESLGAGQLGTDTFFYRATDAHGALSSATPVNVSVAGENDPPVLGGVEGGAGEIVTGPIVTPATNQVTGALTVSDVDRNAGAGGTQMSGATVRIASGFDAAHHDTLVYTPRDGIGGDYDAGTGILTLSGAATPAEYQAALRSVAFTTDDDAPLGDRMIKFQVDDGAAQDSVSNAVTREVRVVSSSPSITVEPALTPSFSRDVSDYAIHCSGDPLSFQVDSPPGTFVAVDGAAGRSGAFARNVDLSNGQAFVFVVTRGTRSDTYHVRCLPPDFPEYEATTQGTPQAQWYFVTPFPSNYAVIFDAHGVPIWWWPAETAPLDFKALSNGHVGYFSTLNASATRHFQEFALDGKLVQVTDTVGTPADFHDYVELPNGNRYMLAYKMRDHVDVSAYTGNAQDMDAAVIDAEIQEVAPDGSLVWSWNSKDHIGLDETGRWWNPTLGAQTGFTGDGRNIYDIFHINAVEPDGDGLIISGRHTDAIYRIDRATGDITWKLGGTHRPESLTIVGDDANAATDFGGQHDPRRMPDGTMTLHDNGTGRGRAPRALRFQLDTAAHTATLVESLSDPLAPNSGCCGSARKLPGGDWVMSWGLNGLVTELTPSGQRPFKLTFPSGSFSYRAAPVVPGVIAASALRAGMDAQYPRP